MKLNLYHSQKSIPELRGVSKALAKRAWKYSWKKSFGHWQAYLAPIVAGCLAGVGVFVNQLAGSDLPLLGAAVGGFLGGVIANQIVIPIQRPYLREFLDRESEPQSLSPHENRSEQGEDTKPDNVPS